MYQKLIATTTLGELVGVGERFSEGTHAKPGKYNVYAVSKTKDDYDTAVLFIHETENQDVKQLWHTMDEGRKLSGCTFGILTMKDENDTWKENNRVKEWLEYLNSSEENFTDGCVIGANYGDGGCQAYMNSEHSVFMFDDMYILPKCLGKKKK